jgi:alpha-tubulin suppressor-like RCC1 family protein
MLHGTWAGLGVRTLLQAFLVFACTGFLVACGGGTGGDPTDVTPSGGDQVSVASQSGDLTVNRGDSAQFVVNISGSGTLTVQWARDGHDIPGATNSVYTLSAVTLADTGARFQARVTGPRNQVLSKEALLTVRPDLAFTTPPASQSVLLGQTSTFTFQAVGEPDSLQWRKNGDDIAGATQASYNAGPVGMTDDGARYTVVIRRGQQTLQSPEAVLTVRPLSLILPVGVSAGRTFSVVWLSDGSAWAFGSGYLGVSGISSSTVPVQVQQANGQAFTGVQMVKSGSLATLALRAGGALWAWGDNSYFALGDHTQVNRNNPVQVVKADGSPLLDVVSFSSGANHGLAATADGRVWRWGDATTPLDMNTTESYAQTMLMSAAGPELTGVVKVASGYAHQLVLKGDGTVWAWGGNLDGGLGSGSLLNSTYPVQVRTSASAYLTNVKAIAAGLYHSLAVTAEGTAWSWGRDLNGEMGGGLRSSSVYAKPVRNAAGAVLQGVADVAAGDSFSIFLMADGRLMACGLNLGPLSVDETAAKVLTASPVVDAAGNPFGDVVSVSAGANHVIALRRDGTVWAWGQNGSSQLTGDASGVVNRPKLVLGIGK